LDKDCPVRVHNAPDYPPSLKYPNIEIMFFLSNTIAFPQSLDQRIIAVLKGLSTWDVSFRLPLKYIEHDPELTITQG